MFSEIEHAVPLVLVVDPSTSGLRVPALLGYRRDDPFAVRLTFPGILGPDEKDLTWLLSLELLEAGLLTAVGDGDVRVVPASAGAIRLHLRSGAAEAVLEAPSRRVERFLRACRQCVRPGEEETGYDWDGAWADLLRRECS
ncbi:SsgA family sporulation/cell division regulator [Streptacidiphilus neutrinimicus]|uniref:SsgA family sporulation/cell division regulator n=1 Tax=Streptacidiphilus neutrinimicus TaxID=105420 RepID=UPI000694FF58|nr:SsgA family sporulation/cell division regulator [Streptacidiphilus neutrinimicus]